MARRKSLAEWLGFKGLGCCGVKIFNSDPGFVNGDPVANGIALEERVAADRDHQQSWASDRGVHGSGEISPTRTESSSESPLFSVPLYRMLQAMNLEDEIGEENNEVGFAGDDSVCCVCMERNKGAALIPCGHTFCRTCSRKLYIVRGACPLCNRRINNFLDLF